MRSDPQRGSRVPETLRSAEPRAGCPRARGRCTTAAAPEARLAPKRGHHSLQAKIARDQPRMGSSKRLRPQGCLRSAPTRPPNYHSAARPAAVAGYCLGDTRRGKRSRGLSQGDPQCSACDSGFVQHRLAGLSLLSTSADTAWLRRVAPQCAPPPYRNSGPCSQRRAMVSTTPPTTIAGESSRSPRSAPAPANGRNGVRAIQSA